VSVDRDQPLIRSASDLGPEAQAQLLEHLAQSGNFVEACALARTTAAAVRRRVKDDPVFAEALATAWDDFKDGVLLPEAKRRAVEGTKKGVYYRGEIGKDEHGQPAYERQFSDALLIRLLEVHDPRFRPHQVVETRQGPQASDLDDLSPEAQARLEAFLEQRAADEQKKHPNGPLPTPPPPPEAPPELD
jgi:hypothetical protein